jgi:hypothetical protein
MPDITTRISGYVRRYNGDYEQNQHRFSYNKTITEGGMSRVVISTGSSDISVMPSGLPSAKTLFLQTDYKVNVTISGKRTASFDVYDDGILCITGSVSDVLLRNRSATSDATVLYDLSG